MKKSLLAAALFCCTNAVFAQSDPIPLNTKQYQLLNRLDIQLGNDSVLGFTTTKPYSRRQITERLDYIDSLDKSGSPKLRLSAVDRANLRSAFLSNVEWTDRNAQLFRTNEPLFEHFYKNQAHLYSVKTDDFFLSVNPVLNFQLGKSSDGTSVFQNTRGIYVRGNIDKRVGFYSYISDNQERYGSYVRSEIAAHNAVPGTAMYKKFKSDAVDYFDVRGGINFNAGKHIDITFAYDKLFIGNGYRSLFLSDYSAPYLYLKIDTRIWKLKYQNIFAELVAPFKNNPGDNLLPKKYTVMHHLSIQPTKWLNVGLFENIMFYRPGRGFDISYANPIIFYRAIESNNGSADKATVGLDFKSNFKNRFQLYGQLLITEFHINEIRNYSRGAWVNKHGFQLGGKYIDAFGLKNLDLLAEVNVVRPFAYTHRDSATTYTHYNQPFAHPLGAGFREFILQANYQPHPRWYFNAKVITYKQGLDSAGKNFGSNIFLNYKTRPRDYGFYIGTGVPVNALYAALNVSYEIIENLFIDGSISTRQYNVSGLPNQNATTYSIGVRMNIQRREFDF